MFPWRQQHKQHKQLQPLLTPAFRISNPAGFEFFCGIIDLSFSFTSLLLLVHLFQEVKILFFAIRSLSKGVTFGPVFAAWESEDRCCSGCYVGVGFCRRAGKKFTWVYQAGPDIYSNVFVYPVPCLLQRSLLRILTLKHVTKSALHSGVHYLSQPM